MLSCWDWRQSRIPAYGQAASRSPAGTQARFRAEVPSSKQSSGGPPHSWPMLRQESGSWRDGATAAISRIGRARNRRRFGCATAVGPGIGGHDPEEQFSSQLTELAAVSHSPAAPQSRPGPRNPLYTFLYNYVLPRNISPSLRTFLALHVAFVILCDLQTTLSKYDFKTKTARSNVLISKTFLLQLSEKKLAQNNISTEQPIAGPDLIPAREFKCGHGYLISCQLEDISVVPGMMPASGYKRGV